MSTRALVIVCVIVGIYATERPCLAKPKTHSQRPGPAWVYDKHVPLYLFGNAPYQMWSKDGTRIQVVAYLPNLKPAKGAWVFVDDRPVGQIGHTGALSFPIRPASRGRRTRYAVRVFALKGSTLYSGQLNFKLYARTKSFESVQVYLHTDRGVYRPGDRIRMRALVWRLRGEYQPKVGARVTVELLAPSGAVVGGQRLTTDRFGLGSGELTLPAHAGEGSYKLRVGFGRTTETTQIRVERFREPQIRVTHDVGRFLTKRQPVWNIRASLGYFVGGLVRRGMLRLSIRRAGQELWHLSQAIDGRSGAYHFSLDSTTLAELKSKLVLNGELEVVFEAKDGSGRRDEVKRVVRYVANSLLAVVETDKDYYATGETVWLNIKVVDLDGVPLKRKPLLVLDFQSPQSSRHRVVTDDNGVARVRLTMGRASFKVEVRAEDSTVLRRAQVFWRAPKPLTPQLEVSVVRERKPVPLRVVFGPGVIPREKWLHGDVTDSSGAIKASFSLPIRRTASGYLASGSFAAPSWGTMLLNFYCLARHESDPKNGVGLLTAGQQVTVHANRTLQIELGSVPKSVRPGGSFQASLRLLRDGKPVTAVVGAMLVDASVISLLDPFEKTPTMHFYQPQRKVMSTTGSKILSWPVVARNWGYPNYDIALPPFRFHRDKGSRPTIAEIPETLRATCRGKTCPRPLSTRKSFDWKKDGHTFSGHGKLGGKIAYKIKPLSKKTTKLKVKEYKSKVPLLLSPTPTPTPSVVKPGYVKSKNGPQQKNERVRRPKPLPKPRVRITIRRRFTPTGFWAPKLVAERGKTSFTVYVPDAITEQRLTILASDERGYLGLRHVAIRVTQPLQVRSDLPATLTEGDVLPVAIAVRNLSQHPENVEVTLRATGLELAGPLSHRLTVAPGETGVVQFRVRAKRPGVATFTVTAKGKARGDRETRTLFVRPSGVSSTTHRRGQLDRSKPLVLPLVKRPGEYTTAFLSLAFPTVVPSLAAWMELERAPLGGVDSASGRLRAVIALSRVLAREPGSDARIGRLRSYARRLITWLVVSQAADGSWGWHWWAGMAAHPLATADALAALAEARMADLYVPDLALTRATAFLLGTQQSDGGWSTRSIQFWEGPSERVRWALTARIYFALVSAERARGQHDSRLDRIESRLRSYEGDDLLTRAFTLRGVLRRHAKSKRNLALKRWIATETAKLIQLRRHGYWEPQWFDAWGGTLQATAAILQALASIDHVRFAAEIRESVRILREARTSFGDWHNGPGTLAALEALSLLPKSGKEVASHVTVSLNGKVVRRVAIDPGDPFASALALARIELSSGLRDGENEVRISYDGALTVPTTLALRRWVPARKSNGTVERRYEGEDRLHAGELVGVKLTVRLDARGPLRGRVVEPLPSDSLPDATSLAALRKRPGVLEVRVEKGRIIIELMLPEPRIELSYRLRCRREGRLVQPAPRLDRYGRGGLGHNAGRSSVLVVQR